MHSCPGTDDRDSARDTHLPWTHHATAALRTAAPAPDPAAPDWAAAWPPPGTTESDLTGLYEELADDGYVYGPAFRCLARLWKAPDGTVYAETRAPEHDGRAATDDEGFALHPALLDAVLHAVVATARSEDGVRLPYASTTSPYTPPEPARCVPGSPAPTTQPSPSTSPNRRDGGSRVSALSGCGPPTPHGSPRRTARRPAPCSPWSGNR
ncbi:polyketide synthase dehydratase domain-containing protein [Streptomyces sp. GKU 257-1]|nr:polyketide synthase dehydratase domain-containing protein [Streptomyces sp. GKU 257-1]